MQHVPAVALVRVVLAKRRAAGQEEEERGERDAAEWEAGGGGRGQRGMGLSESQRCSLDVEAPPPGNMIAECAADERSEDRGDGECHADKGHVLAAVLHGRDLRYCSSATPCGTRSGRHPPRPAR